MDKPNNIAGQCKSPKLEKVTRIFRVLEEYTAQFLNDGVVVFHNFTQVELELTFTVICPQGGVGVILSIIFYPTNILNYRALDVSLICWDRWNTVVFIHR